MFGISVSSEMLWGPSDKKKKEPQMYQTLHFQAASLKRKKADVGNMQKCSDIDEELLTDGHCKANES